MSGKPILQSGRTPNNIVKDADVGESVEPDNPEKIYYSLKKIMEYDKDRLQQIKISSKTYVKKHHNFEVLAKRFISIISNG